MSILVCFGWSYISTAAVPGLIRITEGGRRRVTGGEATPNFYINNKTFFGRFIFTGVSKRELKCSGAKGNGPGPFRPREIAMGPGKTS